VKVLEATLAMAVEDVVDSTTIELVLEVAELLVVLSVDVAETVVELSIDLVETAVELSVEPADVDVELSVDVVEVLVVLMTSTGRDVDDELVELVLDVLIEEELAETTTALAAYKLRRLGPPHMIVVLPAQPMLQVSSLERSPL
jgi:hypothetical protein